LFTNTNEEDLNFSKQIFEQKNVKLENIDRSNPIAVLKNRHKYQIEDMIRAINNDVAPRITGEEARKSVEIIQAIYKSSRTGEEVTLPLN